MDRGRVGTLAIGNKTIRDQMIAHQQEVHMERIRKIMTRKPGSSNTLDNTAPVIIKAALVNPRKIAKKKEFNIMTEKENRVLLKRISNTLTAPPKITDAEYKAMRKLIGNMKGGKQAYEAAIHARHHARYLAHIKNMGPYYDPNEWELDYKRQKVQQMFMREVTYERPKDFKVKELPPMKTLGTIHDKNNFKPHFTQLPSYSGRGSMKTDHGKSKSGPVNRIRSMVRSSSEYSPSKMDQEEPEQNLETEPSEKQVELACTHRFLRVSTGEETEAQGTVRWGEIACYLLDGDLLLICARVRDQSDEKAEDMLPAYEAEAEIDITAIAELRAMDGAKVLEAYRRGEKTDMQNLARYVSESVDLRVEDNVARIILNLTDTDDGPESSDAFFLTEGVTANDDENNASKDMFDVFDPVDADLQLDADSLGEDEVQAYHCSFDEVVCPVRIVGGPKQKAGIRQASADSVTLSTVVSCEMDVITVEACVTQESGTKFKNCSAVPVGTTFTIKSTLPSIMQADGELVKIYFRNLVDNLHVETHHLTGKNAFMLQT
jgi:hypothetical protein